MPRRFENKEEVAAAASCDTPYSAFRGTKFFGSLDGLRAISIMGVVWVHATLASPYYLRFSVLPIIGNGAFGVDIFFAISGFLISTLLLRERDKLGKISLREFYLRRTLRIWPLYYATLAFYAAMALIFYRHSPRGPEFFHYFPGYLTFTYTWFAFRSASKPIFNFAWSLSVEEQFYTLWAPVLRFLDPTLPSPYYGWVDRSSYQRQLRVAGEGFAPGFAVLQNRDQHLGVYMPGGIAGSYT